MMGMKKLAALVMALVLCLTAVSAMANPVEVATRDELYNAIVAAGTNPAEIKLMNDISGNAIDIRNKVNGLVIDFNDKTFTVTGGLVGSKGTESQALRFYKAGSVATLKNGTLTTSKEAGAKFLVQNYASVTFEDMVLDGRNLIGGTISYVVSNNAGNSQFIGTTSIYASADGFAFDVCDYTQAGGTSVTVNTTGEIVGKIEVSGNKNKGREDATLTITKVSEDSKIENINVTVGKAELPKLPLGTRVTVEENTEVKVNGQEIDDNIVIPEMTDVNYKAYKNSLVFSGSGSLQLKSTDEFESFMYAAVYRTKSGKIDYESGYLAMVGKDDAGDVCYYPEGKKYLTAKSGSIEITMSEEFLKTLEPGEYALEINSFGAQATYGGGVVGTFKVDPAAPVSVDLPQTGDNSSLMLWSAMLALAAAGFVASKKVRFN